MGERFLTARGGEWGRGFSQPEGGEVGERLLTARGGGEWGRGFSQPEGGEVGERLLTARGRGSGREASHSQMEGKWGRGFSQPGGVGGEWGRGFSQPEGGEVGERLLTARGWGSGGEASHSQREQS